MNDLHHIGCELNRAARSDLRKAIRCLLIAGAASAALWPVSNRAQEKPDAYDPPMTDFGRVTVTGTRPELRSFTTSAWPLSPQPYTFYLDGMRATPFLGSTDTSGHEDPGEPVTLPNPEPRSELCPQQSTASAFDAIVNNPVDLVDGYKHMTAVDFQSISNRPLAMKRYKNPRWKGHGILGQGWVTNFDTKISFSDKTRSCYPAPGEPSCNISNPDRINFYTERGGIIQLIRTSAGSVWRPEGSSTPHIVTRGPDGKFTLRTQDSFFFSPVYVFKANGFIESLDMRDGNRLDYSYDSNNRLTRVTHNSGRHIAFTWASGTPAAVASITAPNQQVYRYNYYTTGTNYASGVNAPILRQVLFPDGKGNVEYIHEQGTHTVFGDPRPYTHAHKLLQIKVNGAPISNYTYRLFGNNSAAVATSSLADGTNLFHYDYVRYPDSRVVSNPYGRATTYHIDDGKITDVDGASSTNCPATFQSATYDDHGRLEATSDERGIVTLYQYDSQGRRTRKVEAVGTSVERTTRWTYDSDPNNPLRTDLLNKVIVDGETETTYEYTTTDTTGPLLYAAASVKNLTGRGQSGQVRTTTYSYTFHPNGLIATMTEDGPIPGFSDRIIRRYNSLGDLIATENGLGHIRTYTGHNGFGQPARIVNENGAVTEFQYDAVGRIILETAIHNGQQPATSYIYDSFGRQSRVDLPDGTSLNREYDSVGRLVREYHNEGGATFAVKLYSYNSASDVTQIKVQRTTAVTPPASVPVLSASGGGSGSYAVSWSSASGVEYYVLQERFNGGSWSSSNMGSSTSKSFTGRDEGTYSYRVRACNAAGCTAYSTVSNVEVRYPPRSAPTLSVPATNNSGTFAVSWTAVSSADRYELQQRKDAGSWSRVYNASGLSTAVANLTDGTHDFRARACNEHGCSGYSAIKSTQVTHPPSTAPTLTAPSTSNSGAFTVTWTGVSSASRYELQQRMDGGSWSRIHNAASTSRAVADLTNGTYNYRVRACNAGGCATFSTIRTTVVTRPPTGAPTLTAPESNNTGSFTLSWTSVPGATTYYVWQRKDGSGLDPWKNIYSGANRSTSLSALGNGRYEHYVRACNAGGCAADSATRATVVTHPPGTPPSLTTPVSSSNGSFTVTWTSSATATTYRLQQRKNSESWGEIHNGSARSKAVSGLPEATYSYRVRACNAGGCSSYSATGSTIVAAIPSSAPTLWVPGMVNSFLEPSYTVSWSSVSGATSYRLQERHNGGNWSTSSLSQTSITVPTGPGGGSRDYRVQACNTVGCGPYSAIQTVVIENMGGCLPGGHCQDPLGVPVREDLK